MYKDKKVLIFGLGLNDGGLGMAEYFLTQGAKVTITDGKTREELDQTIKKLSKYNDVTYHLGGHQEQDFIDNDIIVRNPAIKPDNRYLGLARSVGKEIVMEMSLFHKLAPCPIIGITGTRGKSTTTTLIFEIFKSVYRDRVFLGGNIGKSAIRTLPKLNNDNLAVLELSSFQLDGMGESKVSPHIAVITNIYRDHLDWHKDMNDYINAKKNIFKNQTRDDFLVLNIDNEIVKKFIYESPSKIITYSLKDCNADYYLDDNLCIYHNGSKIFNLENLNVKGNHNLYNILSAIATTKIYDIPEDNIKRIIENFEGVPNRQDFVKEIDGVKYYNDTCATSVEAIKAMFQRFGDEYEGKIVMIAGGVDKGLQYDNILDDMKMYLKALVLLQGSASEKLSTISTPFIKTYKYFNSIKDAVDKALEISDKGDMVILCPGASSFNMFKNEFDRGKQFVDYVKSI